MFSRPVPLRRLLRGCALAAWLFSAALMLAHGSARADYDGGLAAFESGDYATALAEWLPLAQSGDARAQHGIGLLYETGRGVPERSDKEAVKWYRAAGAQGLPAALSNLALMYAEGRGVARDLSQAAALWEQAALAGHPMAQFNLGLMFYRGEGVTKDDRLAARWFAEAAAQGVSDAQFAIAEMYRLGHGVNKDLTEARRWYAMAAEAGNPAAVRQLAILGGPPPELSAELPPVPPIKPQREAAEPPPAGQIAATGDGAPPPQAAPTTPVTEQPLPAPEVAEVPSAAAEAAEAQSQPEVAALPEQVPEVPPAATEEPVPEIQAEMSTVEAPAVEQIPVEETPGGPPAAEVPAAEVPVTDVPVSEAPSSAEAPSAEVELGADEAAEPVESPPEPTGEPDARVAVGEAVLAEAVPGEAGVPEEEDVEVPQTPAPPEPTPEPVIEPAPAEPPAPAPAEPPPPGDAGPDQGRAVGGEATEGEAILAAPAATPSATDEAPFALDMAPAPPAMGARVVDTPVLDTVGRESIYRVWLSEVDGAEQTAAEAEWRRLQQAYPDLLGQHERLLRRVDLGEGRVLYRVLAGPFDDRADASAFCDAIRARAADEHCMVVLN